MKAFATLLLSLLFSQVLYAQKGEMYTMAKLAKQPISKSKSPTSVDSKFAHDNVNNYDTTYTIYSGSSVSMMVYFVDGAEFDNIFNPNPTGIVLNGKKFKFYCQPEKSKTQNVSDFLDIFETEFSGKRYLILINFNEQGASGLAAKYNCYNVFEITDPNDIKQYSFSSMYVGAETFGDFNLDGELDFIRAASKDPENPADLSLGEHYIIFAHKMAAGKADQIKTPNKQPYYVYARGTEDVSEFTVLKSYWFNPLVDTSGTQRDVSYFPEKVKEFDPFYKYLYDADGVRVDKQRWGVQVKDLSDIDAAKEVCTELNDSGFDEVYIMTDQYAGNIKYQVIVGNFSTKDGALEMIKLLAAKSVTGKLRDLNADY